MARGFGATLGGGATDIIQTQLTTHATERTWLIWFLFNATGGGSIGRLWEKSTGTNASERAQLSTTTGNRLAFFRGWAGGANVGSWECPAPAPSASAWHCLLIYFNSTPVAGLPSTPQFDLDGVAQTMTQTTTPPTGTANTDAGPTYLGNRPSTVDRNWDGCLASFAVWNRLLRGGEKVALAAGWPPLAIHGCLEYVPMVRENVALLGAPSLTGTQVQPNPPLLRPWRATTRLRPKGTTVAGGPVGTLSATLAALAVSAAGTVTAGGGGAAAPRFHYYLQGMGAR